jgi:YfiH family protein
MIDAGYLLGDAVRLVFTDRAGGVSPQPYESLNLAYHTGDSPENVLANRRFVERALGVAAERFIYLEQVHGLKVSRAGPDDVSNQSLHHTASLSETDGVYTTEPGITLAVLTADCVPLALAEPTAGMVAMLHAGWRGTIGNIAGETVSAITAELGLDPRYIHAVMGPAIGPCCYKVDEGRAGLFVEKYGSRSDVVLDAGGYWLDLLSANRANLIESGLRAENIRSVGGCTCCESRFFSFRRDGVTGRQGAFIYLR